MSRILISFIGTGPKDQSKNREEREYKTATYRYGDKEETTEFVALAMKKFFNPDKIFLIGTPHSMWEEVYNSFSEKTDDETWEAIFNWCDSSNYLTPITGLPYKEKIEKAMGDGSKVFLVRYGIDESQLKENINTVLGIREYLNNGDEIIVDITHSFRSLPLLIMQLILYLKQVESPKVRVSHVLYGMLDISNELHYTPIVDISKIIDISDWISGAYSFKNTGSAMKVYDLIKNSDKATATMLKKFSDLLSLNALGQLQTQVQEMRSLNAGKYKSKLEELAIQPTIDEFTKKFKNADTPYIFQYKLAEWQYCKMNYLAAYTTLAEFIVTLVCCQERLQWDNLAQREEAKDRLIKKDRSLKLPDKLIGEYNRIRLIRNGLVHQVDRTTNNMSYKPYYKRNNYGARKPIAEMNSKDMIDEIKYALDLFHDEILKKW